ncbi:hypothetical protein [Pontibacillus yanchengensis]|uniref:Uncharacterized protein n=1 Tax=Pontibacillus yanchengensis Y32 TaxID=1385514 RepID=A0A0A2TEH0_9BACI|nr:hypothetical protein [Pontibacillus yanchengensis]KGP73929.1 hypothetical protein N782_21280 [Pontibacillus yanchengensis Y32]
MYVLLLCVLGVCLVFAAYNVFKEEKTGKNQISLSSEDEEVNHGEREVKQIHAQVKGYSFEESVSNADVIAKVTIEAVAGEVGGNLPKTKFDSTLLDIYKDENSLNETDFIKILQAGTDEVVVNNIEPFQKGDKLILFLSETRNKDNTYWILGEYSNYYEVKGEEIVKKNFVSESLKDISTQVKKKDISLPGLNKEVEKVQQHFEKDVFVNKLKNEINNQQ